MDRIRIGYPAGYLRFFLDQDWIWIFIFEKIWIRTGYLFDFYNKISLRMIQDVTNYGGRGLVFFAIVFIFTKNQNDFVTMCCTHQNE